MTTTTTPTAPSQVHVPDDAKVACGACGIAVPMIRGEFETEVSLSKASFTTTREHYVFFGRCQQCQQIRDTAADLLTAHPEVRVKIGAKTIATHRLEAALEALDALGIDDPAIFDRLTATARDIHQMLNHLTAVGVAARWSARFLPTLAKGFAYDSAASERWSFLTDDERQQLRDAYAALLHARVEQPRAVPCPSGACLMCGVGSVQAMAADAPHVWRETTAHPRSLGGRDSAELVWGHTCPECAAAIASVGSVGVSAMAAAVVTFLKLPRRGYIEQDIGGLLAWVASASDETRQPNDMPWDHLDLTALRAEVSRGGDSPRIDKAHVRHTRECCELADY